MTIKYYLDFEIDDKNDPVRTLHTVQIVTKDLRKELAKIFKWLSPHGQTMYRIIKEDSDITFSLDEIENSFKYYRSCFVEAMRHYFREKLHDTIDYDCDDEILIAKIVKMQVRFKDKKVYDITQFMKA